MSDCVIILCPSGCDCDENLPNADDFCPNNYKCKQCQCLPAGEHLLTNQRSGHPADVQSKTGACHLRITNTVTQPPSCQVIHQASCVACQNHSQKDFSCKPKHTTGIRPLWFLFQTVNVMTRALTRMISVLLGRRVKIASVFLKVQSKLFNKYQLGLVKNNGDLFTSHSRLWLRRVRS